MKPIEFKWMTCHIAKDQPEYKTLPAYRDKVEVISCWRMSFMERLLVLFMGRVWLRQVHCGQSLQPQLLQVESPHAEIKILRKTNMEIMKTIASRDADGFADKLIDRLHGDEEDDDK